MPDDFDLTGLEPSSAKEYVVAIIADLKQTKARRIELEGKLQLWEGRMRLAERENRPDLATKASSQADLVRSDIASVRAQETEYVRGIDRMKRQLTMIESEAGLSVNADLLLAQLELITGERDELSDTFKEEELNEELERMKREMGDET